MSTASLAADPRFSAETIAQRLLEKTGRLGNRSAAQAFLSRVTSLTARTNDQSMIVAFGSAVKAVDLIIQDKASQIGEALAMVITPRPIEELRPGIFYPHAPSRLGRL